MRVLVTGASGLIGRHTVTQLQEAGHAVRTLHRGPALEKVEHVVADVQTDGNLLLEAAQGCGVIVHLAGRGDVAESRRDPVGYAQLNASGTLLALEAARQVGAAFVLASTQRVYALRPTPCREDESPAPDSPYGFAKLAAELWSRMESEQFGVPATILRLFSVYGPGQQANGSSGVVSIFAEAALANRPLNVQSLGKRDFTDARDVARGILLAAEQPAPGLRLYNVATGVGTSFRELAETVIDVFGSSSTIADGDAHDEGCDLVADVSMARRDLGFEPVVPLREGLEHYRDWLLQHD